MFSLVWGKIGVCLAVLTLADTLTSACILREQLTYRAFWKEKSFYDLSLICFLLFAL